MTGTSIVREQRTVGTDEVASEVIPRGLLPLVVLTAGMTTMGTQMAASRLLAPFFGQSILVWANLIGLMLIYLSVGYWWGGRLADRWPTAGALGLVAFGAAVTIAIVPFAAAPVLGIASGGVDALSAGAVLGSFVGTLLLFAVPVTLLGMVPPFAIRLAMHRVQEAGQVAGALYALSTVGSIIGTFGSVLVLIPMIGTRRTLLTCAFLLCLLATIAMRQRWMGMVALLAIAAMFALPVGTVRAADGSEVIFEQESRYQFVQVTERPDGRRMLQLNEGWAVHSIYDPESVVTWGIWDHFVLLRGLVRDPGVGADAPVRTDGAGQARPLRMLMVGNAGGSAARAYRELVPEVQVDGVEIDPLVTEVGSRYFDMDGDNLTVHAADGRPFLARTPGPWEIILVDAYRQPYIPFYLTTREFFSLVAERLAPGGVLAINVGSTPGDDRIREAISGTMRTVFPSVFHYRAESFNEVVLAFAEPVSDAEVRERYARFVAQLTGGSVLEPHEQQRFDRIRAGMEVSLEEVARPARGRDVLRDDRAPIEWITDSMIVDFATEDVSRP